MFILKMKECIAWYIDIEKCIIILKIHDKYIIVIVWIKIKIMCIKVVNTKNYKLLSS